MDIWPTLAALIPSIGVGVLFYVAMRAIVRADRNERGTGIRRARECCSRARLLISAEGPRAASRNDGPPSKNCPSGTARTFRRRGVFN
ncbi:MAG: hypothetical protein ACTMIB_07605 [Cellulosimicrobium funkei]